MQTPSLLIWLFAYVLPASLAGGTLKLLKEEVLSHTNRSAVIVHAGCLVSVTLSQWFLHSHQKIVGSWVPDTFSVSSGIFAFAFAFALLGTP